MIVCMSAFALYLAVPVAAPAQAWLPAKGEGSVSFTYSNMYVRNHVSSKGVKNPDAGQIRTHTFFTSVEYGITDRVAVSADLAYIASKFTNGVPHGPDDTGSYHPTFQDAHIELRYNALNRRLVVTPFIGTTIPTHDYETRGHSAVGRGFHELEIGVNVGRQFESVLPDVYLHGRYSYTVQPRFEGLNLNRSNADWEVGWIATRSLSLRFIGTLQKTHGGLTTPLDREHLDDHVEEFHDRLTRSNRVLLGGGAGFSVNRSFGIHTYYLTTVYGRSTHAPGGFAIGVSWRFSRGLNLGEISVDTSPSSLSASERPVYSRIYSKASK
jgi:hypothetical protein